jgi:hypothetical protein
LADQSGIHDFLGSGSLLNHDLGIHDGLLIDIREVNLEKHEACAVSVGLSKLLSDLVL